MKHKNYILSIIAIILTLFVPLLIFPLQDTIQLYKTYTFPDTQKNHDMIKRYPIIAEIYSSYYSFQNESQTASDKELTTFNNQDERQKAYTKQKKSLEYEMQSLIDHYVLTYRQLNLTSDDAFIQFGTLYDTYDSDYQFMQTFSIDQENVRFSNYSQLKISKKFRIITVSNEEIQKITDQERKKMAKAMIVYLGLEEIDDWIYTEKGYESYNAKLVIYCDMYQYGKGFANIEIGAMPLGQHRTISNDILIAG